MKGECSIQMGSNEADEVGTIHDQDLHGAAMRGDWEAAEAIFDKDPTTMTKTITLTGTTVLHVAASCGESKFVEKLVSKLRPEQLKEMKDQVRCTALHHVALAANVRAAKAIVEKNSEMPQLGDMHSRTPLLYAAKWRHRLKNYEMIKYLYGVTKLEVPSDDNSKKALATELVLAFTASGSHDIALDFLEKHPELALEKDRDGTSILHILAKQPSAFDETKPSLWKWARSQWMLIKTNRGIKNSIELVEFVCQQMRKKKIEQVMEYFIPTGQPAVLHLATKNGAFKLVKICLYYFPIITWYANDGGRLLLHEAIEYRQVDIFNHITHLYGNNTKAYADADVEFQNNILHLAAKSRQSSQLLLVADPAFQMQQELQWFKAVEALVYEENRVATNRKGKTPGVVFFETHKDLLKEAKEWMKSTSNSCMVVASLVATVAFAAMITVPGGNDSGGLPILSRQKLFVIFSVTNGVSMISSAISLLMFLSVQTLVTEEDFLHSLQKSLLGGLIFLFIAVVSMMIAFGTAIGLSLQKMINWAYIPITIVACFPAIIFIQMQLPLFFKTLHLAPKPGKFQAKTTKFFGISKCKSL